MALKILWTKRADQKFDKIITFLLKEWGEQATKDFVGKVHDFFQILQEYPGIGTVENSEKGIRGFTIVKQVNVFYKIDEDSIIVLNFFDNRQNPSLSVVFNYAFLSLCFLSLSYVRK